MKKFAFLMLAFLLAFAGCSRRDIPKIEDHVWQMTTVQSGPQGQPVAYGPERSDASEAGAEMLLLCQAKDGEFTLQDKTNGQTYTGSYRLTDVTPESANYEIVIGDSVGLAVAALTTYHDGSSTPTFIISIDGYALNFSAQADE